MCQTPPHPPAGDAELLSKTVGGGGGLGRRQDQRRPPPPLRAEGHGHGAVDGAQGCTDGAEPVSAQ